MLVPHSVTFCWALVISKFYWSSAGYVQGVLNTLENWNFLARFCFASETGALRYQISYPHTYAVENLLLYYDSDSQWPAVYKTSKTCEQKESVLSRQHYQIVNLSTWSEDQWNLPECTDILRNNEKWFLCDRTIRFNSARERWWYIAISNCNTTKGIYLEYKLWMTNGQPEDFWFYNFSMDEFYILPTDILFFLLELIALLAGVIMAVMLRSRQMLHFTYKLFLFSLLFECTSLLFLCIAYGDYAKTGVGLPLAKLLGEMLTAASVLIFTLMLVLIGKGYTITRGRLSKQGSLKIHLFMTLYVLTYGTLFIYQAKFFDPGEVTYLYESPAGYGLVALRLVGCVWFCYAIYFTLVRYPGKRRFYTVLTIVYTLWFLTGPCMILIANFFLGKWVREKIVNGVEKAVNFIGLFIFLIVTRPSAANSTFPYHARTTQIHTIHEDSAVPASLPQHTYEMNNEQNYDVFTVQRAREDTEARQRNPFARPKSKNKSVTVASTSVENGNASTQQA